ncbi:MAG TPA: nuclear transport factor 2 family protein [Puia sp.]|jgi:ketosteroid isomerase-like protein|nr:nuclear transport factor 2 family protein [Puia sp.]
MNNETTIRARVENWARSVNDKNWDGILAWHHKDIVMYDVPPPFQSVGIDAYRQTWELFFSNSHSFHIVDLHVVAGEDVAFCYAPMKCIYREKLSEREVDLDFRLTIGFKKIGGQWWFIHEHHSVPAE